MNNCDPCQQDITNCGCTDTCPIKLDFKCIIYNKDNDSLSSLDGLNLPNGSTLKLLAESVDEKIKQLNVISFNLPFIRTSAVVNTMQQFCESVDVRLQALNTSVTSLSTLVSTPITATDTSTIDFTTSGTLNHTISAFVKISSSVNNLISTNIDGLYVSPQTLSLDNVNKTISISNGNTINLSSMICTPNGFLGNNSNDPTSAINGNYWWNTTSNTLKIKVNNTIRTITTT